MVNGYIRCQNSLTINLTSLIIVFRCSNLHVFEHLKIPLLMSFDTSLIFFYTNNFSIKIENDNEERKMSREVVMKFVRTRLETDDAICGRGGQ